MSSVELAAARVAWETFAGKARESARRVSEVLSAYWLPALIFLTLPVYEIARALTEHNYVQRAAIVHDQTLGALSALCFIAAAWLSCIGETRRVAVAHLEALGRGSRRHHALWLGLGFVGLGAWLWFIRYCEYRGFMLALDTTDNVSMAHHFLRYGRLVRPAEGMHNGLSQHFCLLEAIFSPLLLLGRSPVPLLLLENLVLVSGPFAVYGIVWCLTESSFAAFVGMFLALSSPVFYEVLTANFCFSFNWRGVLMLWAMFFAARNRWRTFGVLALLLVGCTEEMPLVFFGLGLYAIHALGWRRKGSWLIGLGICAASVCLWAFEKDLMHTLAGFEDAGARAVFIREEHFRLLVPAGTPGDRILSAMLLHPLRTLRGLFASRYNFYPTLQILFSSGFLALLSPWNLIPFACADLPHLLATLQIRPQGFLDAIPKTAGFQNFGLRYGAVVWGPLFWATAYGVRRAYAWLLRRGGEGWLLVWALLIGGFGFRVAHRTLIIDFPLNLRWFDSLPRLASQIPANARVWADEWALPILSNRSWVDMMSWEPLAPHERVFRPDYILFVGEYALSAHPPFRDQVLSFMSNEKYEKVTEEGDLFLLRAPKVDPDPDATPQWVQLPPAGSAVAAHVPGAQGNPAPKAPKAPKEDVEAINNKAGVLFNQGRIDDAVVLFKKVVALSPGFAPAHNNLGHIYVGRGKFDEAEAELRAALMLAPDNAAVHFNLGNCFLGKGRLADAAREYEQAVTLDPNHEAARQNLLRLRGLLKPAAP